ncbi:MAG: 30S ribosomal protein S16 [Proteobacteria bacterium]|nr:30S ribosomal protein S16 [Pseudomonadota bacterium]
MPVRIRLARGGAKKRPFYRIVVADSRRARDGKFIDQVGTYNPMLPKDSPERVKIDVEKTKDWIAKGAQPSDRVTLFLSKLDVVEKPVITEKTKQHLPKKKAQERLAAAKEKEEAAKAEAEAPAPAEAEAPAEAPAEEEAEASAEADDKKTE